MLDSPTNNFCTLNPLDTSPTGTISEGNLQQDSYTNTWRGIRSTHFVDSGKWYWEVELNSGTGADRGMVGVSNSSASLTTHADSNCRFYNASGGQKYSSSSSSAYGNASYNGDIVGVALDMDNGKIWWAINNVWQASGSPTSGTNEAFSGLTGEWSPDCRQYTTYNWVANFGQDSSFAGNKTAQGNQDSNSIGDFYYTPPTGYLALCTQNLPEPTVVPSEHFNTVIYTGNSSTQSITGVGFQPDMLWFKSRSATENHAVFDSVRPFQAALRPNSTIAEYSNTDTDDLDSVDSAGFTLNGNGGTLNTSGNTYVAWNWKAGGADVLNENGTIDSQVSANADAGFSIVSYTGNGTSGATVGHGLSSKPDMIFLKIRSSSGEGPVYHSSLGSGYNLVISNTDPKNPSAGAWDSTDPTNALFSLGSWSTVNGSGSTFIAYCFHSVAQYSKVFSYTGNGSTDGTFVYCDFRPAYVLIKASSTAGESWYILDGERSSYNALKHRLIANFSNAEISSTDYCDFNSNGFKIRWSDVGLNGNGVTYIGIAFAELPAKYNNAR
jgi:hypothetical protein